MEANTCTRIRPTDARLHHIPVVNQLLMEMGMIAFEVLTTDGTGARANFSTVLFTPGAREM